jgi:hypothetical protein
MLFSTMPHLAALPLILRLSYLCSSKCLRSSWTDDLFGTARYNSRRLTTTDHLSIDIVGDEYLPWYAKFSLKLFSSL